MKKTLIIFFLSFSLFGFTQTLEIFKTDFKNSLNSNFNETDLNKILYKHTMFLVPQSKTKTLKVGIKVETVTSFPLGSFKHDKMYQNNISRLFNSTNSYQRILAYSVIAAVNDKSFETKLLTKLKSETNKSNLIACSKTLLYLKTLRTTEMLDFIVKHQINSEKHILPLYFKLDSTSLLATAYKSIKSENDLTKILSAQILSMHKNKKSEKLLLKAVKNWDPQIKGYAINPVRVLEIGNLLKSFKPLLDDSLLTRNITIEALANSPTKKDVDYLKKLISNQNVVQADLLNGFYKSTKIDNIKYWLSILRTRPFVQNYYVKSINQPLIYSNEALEDVLLTIEQCKRNTIVRDLIDVIKDRKDEKSINTLCKLLSHDNSSIRKQASTVLRDSKSTFISNQIAKLLKTDYKTVEFTEILILKDLGTLQSVYDSIYLKNKELKWQESSIKYLSNYPLENHKAIFKAVLNNKEKSIISKRNAALGLGKLKDDSSVDLIIKICKKENASVSENINDFLSALGMIKGTKAKEYINGFYTNGNKETKQIAKRILYNWNR